MIYDFKKADEMMDRLGVDPLQFHLLFLLYHRQDNSSTTAQIERFKAVVLENESQDVLRGRIDDLVEKGLVENFNTGSSERPAYMVDRLVVTPYFEAALVAVDCGEELWKTYPATFPLNDGKFTAKIGDKDAILATYERKIRKDLSLHKHVLTQLDKYVRMVKAGRINGMKIQNFVESEFWDSLAEMNENESVRHGELV